MTQRQQTRFEALSPKRKLLVVLAGVYILFCFALGLYLFDAKIYEHMDHFALCSILLILVLNEFLAMIFAFMLLDNYVIGNKVK